MANDNPQDMEQLIALMAQDPMIRAQLEQAMGAAQQQQQRQHSSPLGAAFGGLANVVNAYRAAQLQKQSQEHETQKGQVRTRLLRRMTADPNTPAMAQPGAATRAMGGLPGATMAPGLPGASYGGAPVYTGGQGAAGLMGQAAAPKPVDPRMEQLRMALLGASSGDPMLGRLGGLQLQRFQSEDAARAEQARNARELQEKMDAEIRGYELQRKRDEALEVGKDRRARILAGQKDAAAERERVADVSALEVPGFVRVSGAPGIKVEEARDMREAVAARGKLAELIEEARTFKAGAADPKTGKRSGGAGRSLFPGTDEKASAGAQATNLLLGLKALGKTGALDEGTINVATKLIPTEYDSAGQAERKLDQFQKFVDAEVSSKARSLGYAPSGRKFRNPKTGEVLPAYTDAEARAFQANGWAAQ